MNHVPFVTRELSIFEFVVLVGRVKQQTSLATNPCLEIFYFLFFLGHNKSEHGWFRENS